jgi:hypothetical protein
MTFNGTRIEDEAPAVELALANVKLVFERVRQQLQPSNPATITVTVKRAPK